MNQRNQDRFGTSNGNRGDEGRDDRWSRDRSQSSSPQQGDRGDSMRSGGYGDSYGGSGYRGGSGFGGGQGSNRDGGSRTQDGFDRDYRGGGSMRDRDDGRMGTQGYGMSDYGSARGGSEYDMRDYNDGRGRNYGSSDFAGSQGRELGASSWTGSRAREYDGLGSMSGMGSMGGMGSGGMGQSGYRGSNDHRSQSWRGSNDDGGYGMQGSSGFSSTVGGGYGVRQKGGSSGYADVSDYGRGGGYGGMRSGIDYGAAANRDNQDFTRGFTHDDRGHHSFGERVEEWGHRAKEGIKDFFGGPKNYKRSDERIREDVCDRLQHLGSRGHLDPSDIEVTVKDGEVTLSGTVPQREWKHRAEDLAEAVSGVREVENRIRVQRGDASSMSSSLGKSGRGASSSTSSSATTSSASGNGNGNTTTAKS